MERGVSKNEIEGLNGKTRIFPWREKDLIKEEGGAGQMNRRLYKKWHKTFFGEDENGGGGVCCVKKNV